MNALRIAVAAAVAAALVPSVAEAGTYTVHNPNTGSNLSVVVSAAGRVSIQ